MSGMSQWWPLFQLRLQTPRLELRLPSDSDLDVLAGLAASGVHDPAVQPFAIPWTDVPPPQRARSVLQYHWLQRAAWKPDSWTLDFAVVRDGMVVGTQGMSAHDFAVLREVSTGSWLGREHHGAGTGTEMRAGVLHLAFAGLGAQSAMSGAFTDNPASLAVSRKLGYVVDGIERHVSRGQPAKTMRLRLDRQTWEATHAVPVTIIGLEPCLPLFGLRARRRDAG
ncbi:MAG TPA: GNAT family N-acetyltransferase [Streptosporangiaceae bacterium]|nr:GNAT family N-acetyltransferase [Streptosporangiaceae bacterium]